jgi:hypothetical protein
MIKVMPVLICPAEFLKAAEDRGLGLFTAESDSPVIVSSMLLCRGKVSGDDRRKFIPIAVCEKRDD